MGTYLAYFANAGVPATGLTLTWESLKRIDTHADYASQPTFSEVGGGFYDFEIVPPVGLIGVIDGSATLTDDADRYVPVTLLPDDFNIDAAITTRPNLAAIEGSTVLAKEATTESLIASLVEGKRKKIVPGGGGNLYDIEIYDVTGVSLIGTLKVADVNGVLTRTWVVAP